MASKKKKKKTKKTVKKKPNKKAVKNKVQGNRSNGNLHRSFSVLARKKLGAIVAGDWVEVARQSTGPAAIVSIAPRSSVLERPGRRGDVKAVAANLTRLVIVSAIRPGIDTLLIDSYCCAAERAGIEPVLLINKSDLLDRVQLASVTDMLECLLVAVVRGAALPQ